MNIKRFEQTKSIELDENNIDEAATIFKALGNQKRMQMLYVLNQGPQTISKLASLVNLPLSNAIFHISLLEKAGIIKITSLNSSTIISLLIRGVDLNINHDFTIYNKEKKIEEYEIEVGSYIEIEDFVNSVKCVSSSGFTQVSGDDPFNHERINAKLIEICSGNITYPLKPVQKNNKLSEICISLEICSEAPFSFEDYKSDIAFKINNTVLLTFVLPGDFGSRRGLLNPDWYSNELSQYGRLETVILNKKGVYLNGKLLNSNVTIDDVDLSYRPTLTIGNMSSSRNKGGLNIFGDAFGDYKQNIKVVYKFEE